MKNFMNSIKVNKPKKNSFDLSHDFKLSASMGNLIPILTLPCLPGDRHTLGCESLIRFAPLIAPVMHRMDVTMTYFFVPNRLIWKNWEKFATDANSGHVKPFIPVSTSTITDGSPEQKFMDYMGVPPNSTANSQNVNALPFLAYQKIWNDYYRDQNLIPPIDMLADDGNVTAQPNLWPEIVTQRKRAWEHDYFTSCLPFAQKGSAVDIPLGSLTTSYKKIEGIDNLGGSDPIATTTTAIYDVPNAPSPLVPGLYAPGQTVDVDPTTINDLRRAFSLQRWLEANARAGTRYVENLWARWFVKSSDARLQRPEFITSVKTPVIISEVLNTTGEDGGLPQGNMAGHGISIASGNSGSYFCEEHGYIIGIMSILPRTAYQQGIARDFLKFDTLDDLQPEFANIGEQEVFNAEIMAYQDSGGLDTFGYIPRYSEYRYMPSRVAGDFRTTLDYWHLGRIFSSMPALNQTFIECDPSNTTRIFAVEDGTDPLFCHVYNKIQSVRPLPKFGTPQSY